MLMLPAPAQGALAVECRTGDAALLEQLAALDHAATHAAVRAERALLAALEAGCSAPVGALAEVTEDNEMYLRGAVIAVDGSDAVRLSGTGTPSDAEAIGRRLAATLLDEGADSLMGSTR
jgi:hydroxymethylbilane synthase